MIEEADSEDGSDAGAITLGLWRAACITYRRCWDKTGRSAIDRSQTRMDLLDLWLDECGIDHARDTHQQVVTQADKNAAHRVDDSEQYRVAVFLTPPTDEPAIQGIATFAAVLAAPMDLVPRLLELANALAAITYTQVQRGYDLTREIAEAEGVENLYQWAASGSWFSSSSCSRWSGSSITSQPAHMCCDVRGSLQHLGKFL
jgi:hypothetical protein